MVPLCSDYVSRCVVTVVVLLKIWTNFLPNRQICVREFMDHTGDSYLYTLHLMFSWVVKEMSLSREGEGEYSFVLAKASLCSLAFVKKRKFLCSRFKYV